MRELQDAHDPEHEIRVHLSPTQRSDGRRTVAFAMHSYGGEPVVPNEIVFLIWDVSPGRGVDVHLGESKVDHIDHLLIGWQPDDTVPELDVSVQDAARVHEIQSGYLAARSVEGPEIDADKV